MVNINKLRGAIVERGMNIEALADKIGMDRSTLYRRISDKKDAFTIREADAIARELNLSCAEATAIFFAQFVA